MRRGLLLLLSLVQRSFAISLLQMNPLEHIHNPFQQPDAESPPFKIGRALAEAQKAAEATSQKAAAAQQKALAEAQKAAEVTSQRAAEAQQKAVEAQQTVFRATLSAVEELEKQLQHVVDDPAMSFLVGHAKRLIGDGENMLTNFAQRVCSANGWRRTGRLLRAGDVEDLTGSWSIAERHGMDEFLKQLGFNIVQRTAVLKAGQVQVIRKQGPYLHIVTRDIRGTSELVLPLDGPPVTGEGDGNAPVARRAYTDRTAKGSDLVITETALGDAQPLSVCRRSLLEDGRLSVDVRKRNDKGEVAHMRIVFSPVGSSQSGDIASTEAADASERQRPRA